MIRSVLILAMMVLAACQSLEPRPAESSYSCMRAARDQVVHELGLDAPDKHLHCVVSAKIARQCSTAEAWLAGLGKEVRDLFTGGDAEWTDWQADRLGVRCGRSIADEQDISNCCVLGGY